MKYKTDYFCNNSVFTIYLQLLIKHKLLLSMFIFNYQHITLSKKKKKI